MKIKLALVLAYFFWNFNGFSQCPDCTDTTNSITYKGEGVFSAASAQAYYWEICSGGGVIVGSNTTKQITVSCNMGNFNIRVVRFLNGNCMVACETFMCDNGMIGEGGSEGGGNPGSSGNCPSVEDIKFSNEAGNGLCATGMVTIENLEKIDYVEWTWALAGHSGTIETKGNSASIYYPQGDWTNYYLAICAKITFEDGTDCTKKCKSFLLDCGKANGGQNSKSIVFPNPSKNHFTVQSMRKNLKIVQVEISNTYGMIIQSKKNDEGLNHVDLSGEQNGLYFISIHYSDGSSETKKVMVSK
ncbi:T9SS type A sorting domain-containing protein [Flagellimonas myxillae]|uniref:T9SS type A sorting domain-containing protein n=1 Tax=Flagellimonas myxillae TaxID=2942214 RepID=UPI00201F1F2C|nr:T9SS type A sorting domain-containing protein [Muricauda myxillae]MCL6268276.1 T9SS type A sorting domain-containing protein [Muricauda myxillae]